MTRRLVRFLLLLLLSMVIAGALTVLFNAAWMAVGGGEMSGHGWIALGLGTFGTVGLAWLLMSLAFRSDRDGWDDQVDNTFDPGRTTDDDDPDVS